MFSWIKMIKDEKLSYLCSSCCGVDKTAISQGERLLITSPDVVSYRQKPASICISCIWMHMKEFSIKPRENRVDPHHIGPIRLHLISHEVWALSQWYSLSSMSKWPPRNQTFDMPEINKVPKVTIDLLITSCFPARPCNQMVTASILPNLSQLQPLYTCYCSLPQHIF